MYLAWVEVKAEQHSGTNRIELSAADSFAPCPSGPGIGHALGEPADCRMVSREFPGLRAARTWAAEQLTQRSDVTGNAAVFETCGPLVRLAWKRRPLAARRPRAARKTGPAVAN